MIPCIGLASGLGAGNDGCGKGPLFLKEHLKIDGLFWHKMITDQTEPKNKYDIIADLNRKLSQESNRLSEKNPFILSFGGDHSSAVGFFSGVAFQKNKNNHDVGLIWIDAHMDAHTPETSDSGNIHGMPIAALLGYGDKRLTNILYGNPKIKPENLFLIGIRSFEEKEAEFLKRMNVKIYFIDEVLQRGFKTVLEEVLNVFQQRQLQYCVSFDLDAIDPKFVKGTGTPVPNGIHPDDVMDALELFASQPPIGFELVEYNPDLDVDRKTFEITQELLKKLVKEVRVAN